MNQPNPDLIKIRKTTPCLPAARNAWPPSISFGTTREDYYMIVTPDQVSADNKSGKTLDNFLINPDDYGSVGILLIVSDNQHPKRRQPLDS
jgi:hypothetical protein